MFRELEIKTQENSVLETEIKNLLNEKINTEENFNIFIKAKENEKFKMQNKIKELEFSLDNYCQNLLDIKTSYEQTFNEYNEEIFTLKEASYKKIFQLQKQLEQVILKDTSPIIRVEQFNNHNLNFNYENNINSEYNKDDNRYNEQNNKKRMLVISTNEDHALRNRIDDQINSVNILIKIIIIFIVLIIILF